MLHDDFLFIDHLTTMFYAQIQIASDGTMTRGYNFERNLSWPIQSFLLLLLRMWKITIRLPAGRLVAGCELAKTAPPPWI